MQNTKTGRKKCCTNNICDLSGNVEEMTQEKQGCINRVVRGGTYLQTQITRENSEICKFQSLSFFIVFYIIEAQHKRTNFRKKY